MSEKVGEQEDEQKIIIIGTGNIGTEVLRQVAQKDVANLGIHANPTNVVGMCNRGGYLFKPEGIEIQNDLKLITELQQKSRTGLKDWVAEQDNFCKGGNIWDILNEVRNKKMIKDVVFVDLTADDTTKFHEQVIREGGKIVTANKIPVAQSSQEVFDLLTKFRQRYGYSCSVMAGSGIIHFLQNCFDTRNKVTKIEGCFSGTLGKLCNLMYEGEMTFSEAIAELRENKDTEPDPRDDLSGMDVVKKIVILARTAGYHINIEDVKLEPFIKEGFRELGKDNCDIEKFMANASIFNDEIAERFNSAKKHGKKLRYVASLTLEDGNPIVTVGLREEDKDSMLDNLTGNENRILVYPETYDGAHQMVSAPGSGTRVTAGHIRDDLADLLTNRQM